MPGSDGLDVPLGDSEVAGLAKSVERYRRSWIAKGRFYTEAEREAWGRVLGVRGGPASGASRRKGTAGRDQLMLGGGSMGKRLTQAQIAALHGVQPTVSYVMRRAGHSSGLIGVPRGAAGPGARQRAPRCMRRRCGGPLTL